MKLYSRDAKPEVRTDPGARRPVLLRVCGLYFAFHTGEARRLADALHDAADATDRRAP